MIERLSEYEITSRDGSFINVDCNTKIINTLVRKINELVDAVNEIMTWRFETDEDSDWYDDPKHREPADPYKEQQKWIGKLCKFWDYDDEEKWFSILEHIDKNSPYPYCASGDWWYKHCEPVGIDDDFIYKKEQQ